MKQQKKNKRTSIFRAIFVPLIFIMILQSIIFYSVAVYGGIEDSLNQNAADILAERLTNRKNELETEFNKNWTVLKDCEEYLDSLYENYEQKVGTAPFSKSKSTQVKFLAESSDTLIHTLRQNQVNGVFLILNDQTKPTAFPTGQSDQKYGLCIRDRDQNSSYTNREDLLIARSPSSIVDQVGCSLDSWWEAHYSFTSEEDGSYFYNPLNAAWENPDADSDDLSYFCGTHSFSKSMQNVVSYSIPLMDSEGKPYGVLGVELTTKYLSSLLPNDELSDSTKSCYVLALHEADSSDYSPIVASGSLFSRCFHASDTISVTDAASTGGFHVTGLGDILLYGEQAELNIYNNNNPFEDTQLTLLALVDNDTLFLYSHRIKFTLLWVTILSLCLGVFGIFIVSRYFSAPIIALARRARQMQPKPDFVLGHIGISEIDQLVDSIEALNQNVSKEIARTEFFSRMSHDMRTPMNAIISFSSSELLDGTNEKQKIDYLQKIHTSGNYLLGLINEVLDMTKIESNKVDLHYQPCSAHTIWDTIISMVDELAASKHVHFVKRIDAPENLFILADEQHLNQIVMNLLSNAVKFTPKDGTVSLTVIFQPDAAHAERMSCHITVKDTGIGMSEAFLQKLYTPFEQENTNQGGTGLGLSISKKLVTLMQGSIQCVSKKHEGTQFDVQLPFQKCEAIAQPSGAPATATATTETTATTADKAVPPSDAVLSGKHFLLCEDHPLNTQIAKKLLERKGITVDTAANGQIGVDTFSASPIGTYDAVLMDIRMPVLDGLGAARAIRALDRTDAKNIPIIAMTANAFEEDMRQSREAGMNAHLSKPIEPDKLYATLCSFLSKQ